MPSRMIISRTDFTWEVINPATRRGSLLRVNRSHDIHALPEETLHAVGGYQRVIVHGRFDPSPDFVQAWKSKQAKSCVSDRGPMLGNRAQGPRRRSLRCTQPCARASEALLAVYRDRHRERCRERESGAQMHGIWLYAGSTLRTCRLGGTHGRQRELHTIKC